MALTTSLDGLWALQVMCGVERVCPELGLRPHDPRTEPPQLAASLPVVSELVEQRAITADGDSAFMVDKPIVDWLTVLSRREVALTMLIHQSGQQSDLPRRVALCRRGKWWVSLSVFDNDTVCMQPMGVATCADAAARLIEREISAVCGTCEPAAFKPLTVPTGRLRSCRAVRDVQQLMIDAGADVDQLRAGLALSNSGTSAQASVCAFEQGQNALPVVSSHVVTIADTPLGRIMIKNITRDREQWTIIFPGISHRITIALRELLSTLPSRDDWYSVRNPFA